MSPKLMCFSPVASFTATALLIPLGIYTSKMAWDKEIRFVPLAMIPVFFGIQQGVEGYEWLNLNHQNVEMIHWGALGFTFFSHGFWLVWPALVMFALEQRRWVKNVCLTIAIIGFLFAASIYGPFLLYPDWLSASIQQGSIAYSTQLIYDRVFPREVSRLIYMVIVLGPLCLSALGKLRLLGGLIALALVVTYCFYNYAFVSVWCFWAALLSLYIARILQELDLEQV